MYRTAFLAAATLASSSAFAQTAAPTPATAPAAAPAAAAAAPTAGATVYDGQGAVVGTIASVSGGNAVIDTGSVKAAVPVASLGTGPKGPTLGLTKAQLEAAANQQSGASADFKSKLVAGAQVYGSGGTPVGTIKAVDTQFVTLSTPHGDAKLPITGFGPGPQGVTVGLSAEQLAAAIGGAKAAATPATAPATATPPKK